MAAKEDVKLTKEDIAVLDRACAVLADMKRRAAASNRNSEIVQEAYLTELREVERVRTKINTMELPF